MKTPEDGCVVRELARNAQIVIVLVSGIDCSLKGNGYQLSTTGYTVGSIQVRSGNAGTLSTGAITPMVSNDGDVTAAHPDGTGLSAVGVSSGLALEYGFFGFEVTTAQSSCTVDVLICLKE